MLRDVRREGQRARDRRVVAIGDGGADGGPVLHRYRVAGRLAELGRDRRRAALGHRVGDRAKADRERAGRGGAVERHIIDVVGLRARRGDGAQRPTMHLGQPEAVVGRAIADLFAVHAGEWDLDLLPAAEVVGKVNRPALGIVRGCAGVAVVEHIHKQGGAAVVAVEPERDARVGAPVLRDPLIKRGVLEAMSDAGIRDDIEIHLQHVVGAARARNRRA